MATLVCFAYNLGELLKQRGDLEGAGAAWRRSDARGNPDATNRLAGLLQERGDSAVAEAAYRRADQSGSAEAANSVGNMLEQRGQLIEAEAAYRRADNRYNADGTENLARILLRRGELAAGRPAQQRAEARRRVESASNKERERMDRMRKAIDWLRSGHAYLVIHDHESLARSVMFRTQPEGARLDVVLVPGEHEALKARLADDA